MRLAIAVVLAGCALAAETMTNADVIKLVRSGVSSGVVIAAINGSDPQFLLTPGEMDALSRAGVSEEIIKAMAARQSGRVATPTPPVRAQAQPGTPPPAPAAASRVDQPDYMYRGANEFNFAITGIVPHSDFDSATAFVVGRYGRFFARNQSVGVDVSVGFASGGATGTAGAFYRYYVDTGGAMFPYLGGGPGVIFTGDASRFTALAEGGLRTFVAPRIAIDAGYVMRYVNTSGSFRDSTVSILQVGFAHVF
jgi:hypothetical protein